MKKPISILLTACFLFAQTSGQTASEETRSEYLQWLTNYQGTGSVGSNTGKGICVGPDGRIFATGQVATTQSGNSNMPVIAINPDGSIDWAYEFHGGGYDMGYAIVADADGNVYAAGESDVSGVWRFTVFSVNPLGELRWVYHKPASNPSAAFDIIIAPDGHIYAGGVFDMGGSQNPGKAFLASITTEGVERWTHTLVPPQGGFGVVNSIAADAESNIYAAGTVDNNYLVYSVNSQGEQRWLNTYSGSASGMFKDNSAQSVIAGYDGNIYVTGKFDEVGQSRVFMTMSFTSGGDLRWQHMHAGSSGHADVAWSITMADDHSVYVAGKGVETGVMDVWVVIKYNTNGEQLWIHFENPTPGINGLNSVATDSFGNIYACGWTSGGSGGGGPRFGALGLTSNGELLFTHVFTPAGQNGTGDQVVIGNNGVAYMVGFSGAAMSPGFFQVAAFQLESLLPGDANCDGIVNVIDVITISNYIMGLNPEPFCFENADVNGDGAITVVDVIGTVNIIMGKNGQ